MMVNIPTKSEQALIKKYVENQEFKNKETEDTITDILFILLSLGQHMKKALNNADAIIKSMKNEYEEVVKKEVEQACAFDNNRECEENCVAQGSREKGCAGWYEWCERGNFWIGGRNSSRKFIR